jgi:prepilin-type N-terminal cleavage/methylation domain-containing protein/prepilin-type processing-associated H-X9-DG protein
MSTSSAIRRGLTLVELLAVIAIIGLVAGLLLPAVQSVRESARRTSCASNIKQIGIGVQSFSEAMGGFPPLATGNGSDGRTYAGIAFWGLIMPHCEQMAAVANVTWDDGIAINWSVSSGYDQSYVTPARTANWQAFSSTYPPYMICPTRGFRTTRNNSALQKYPASDFGLITVFGNNWVSRLDRLICYGMNAPTSTSIPRGTRTNCIPSWGSMTDATATGIGFGVLSLAAGPRNASGDIVTHVTNAAPTAAAYAGWSPRTKIAHVLDGLSNTAILAEKHLTRGHLGRGGCYGTTQRSDCAGGSGLDDMQLMIAQAGGGNRMWVNPERGGIARGADEESSATTFGSWHPGACHFLMADGAVRAVSPDIDDPTLVNICDRRDGQIILDPSRF